MNKDDSYIYQAVHTKYKITEKIVLFCFSKHIMFRKKKKQHKTTT